MTSCKLFYRQILVQCKGFFKLVIKDTTTVFIEIVLHAMHISIKAQFF